MTSVKHNTFHKGLNEGIQQEIQQGSEQGEEKVTPNHIMGMLKKGIEPIIISEMTGVSREKILEIKENLK